MIQHKTQLIALSAGALVALSVAAQAQTPAAPPPASNTVSMKADIKGPAGQAFGTATITQGTDGRSRGVVLRLELKGLPAGWHGMHFHNKADCSAADFTSAGPHVHTIEPVIHGFFADKANDSGDLPNVFVGADGTATVDVFSPFVLLEPKAGDERPALLDTDGSALVIHANTDDYKAQPIGGAGARIACGVIKR